MPLKMQEKTITLICRECGKVLVVDKLVEALYKGWKDDLCKECAKHDTTGKDLQGQRDRPLS